MTSDVVSLPRYRPVVRADQQCAARGTALAAWRPSERLVLFMASLAGYVVVGAEMVHRRVIFADGVSRVANGYFVLFSRDPHLPAVGFVWNPLPSLLLLPVLPLKAAFPILVRDGFAGNLESAVFMAGSVALLAGCLAKMKVRRGPRLVLTVLFALHPMIVTYAGSGESEAMLLFFLLLTVRSLLGWLEDRQPGQLVGTGLALGLAYLTRYEAVAPALAVTALVGGLTLATSTGSRSFRARLAVNDAALVGLPFAFAFGFWAVSSKVLVHEWFPTFSSQYGNSAQVSGAKSFIAQATGRTHLEALGYAWDQLSGLEPLFLPLLVLVAVVAVRRRDWAALAAPTVLGAVLAFDNLAFLSGSSFGWLRFQITVIPLVVLAAGTLLAGHPPRPAADQRPGTRLRLLAVPLVLLVVAAALPVSAWTLTSHRLAREETATMLAAVAPSRATAEDRRHLLIFQTERQVADYLDRLNPGPGTVLTDSAFAFPVLLASRRPRQFVITSDRDFQPSVAAPRERGIRYLLVPEPAKAPSDALERAWPGLYESGAGIARLVAQWKGTSFNGDWRLLRVDPS